MLMSIYLPEIAASYNRQSSGTSYQRYSRPEAAVRAITTGRHRPYTVCRGSPHHSLLTPEVMSTGLLAGVNGTYIQSVVEHALSVVAPAVAGVTHPDTFLAQWLT